MTAQLEESITRFKEAILGLIKVNTRVNQKFKDIKMIRWLQPGNLVVVYRPAGKAGKHPVSAELLFQFTGPFRIVEVKHNAVKLQNLDGSKADTQNVNNVYPFSREDDKALQQIEGGLLPPQTSSHVEFQVDQCFVYDLSEGKDVDFRIIRMVVWSTRIIL